MDHHIDIYLMQFFRVIWPLDNQLFTTDWLQSHYLMLTSMSKVTEMAISDVYEDTYSYMQVTICHTTYFISASNFRQRLCVEIYQK